MNLDLSDGETAALTKELVKVSGNDRSRSREGDLLICRPLRGSIEGVSAREARA